MSTRLFVVLALFVAACGQSSEAENLRASLEATESQVDELTDENQNLATDLASVEQAVTELEEAIVEQEEALADAADLAEDLESEATDNLSEAER